MLYQKNPAMEFIDTDETSLVVFNPENGDTCIIDETGVALFKAIGDGAALETIVDTLLLEYDAPREEIEADVSEFLDQLVQQKVLILCD